MMLSIVVINYNSLAYTIDCINSIYLSDFTGSYEIILIDNHSTEDPCTIIKERFPNVKYFRSPNNVGFAKGNILGIDHSEGDIILLLNNDTIVQKDTIRITYNQLIKNKSVGALTCRLLYPDGKVQHNCQAFPSRKKENIEKLRLHKLMPKHKRSSFMQGFYWDYTKAGRPDWIWGTYFIFPREILNKLPNGQLNDEFFMYIEDMQWCWDIRKAGYEVYYTPEASIIHFGGGSGGAKSNLMEENFQKFLRKNY